MLVDKGPGRGREGAASCHTATPVTPLSSMSGCCSAQRPLALNSIGRFCCGRRELRARRDYPQSFNLLFSSRRRLLLQEPLGTGSRNESQHASGLRSSLRFSKIMRGTSVVRPAYAAESPDLSSLCVASPSLGRLVFIVGPSSPPALLHQRWLSRLSAFACENLRCRRGPRERGHTRAKIAF